MELVPPQLLFQFDQFTTDIVEVEPDIFFIFTTSVKGDAPSRLWKLDMNNFAKISPEFAEPVPVFTFPAAAKALNGSCLLGSRTILLADSWTDLIWRVDIPTDESAIDASVWLQHRMLAHVPAKVDVPGVNGIKFNPKDQHVYFTSTAQTIFGRIAVTSETLSPRGEPHEVTERGMEDIGTHMKAWLDRQQWSG